VSSFSTCIAFLIVAKRLHQRNERTNERKKREREREKERKRERERERGKEREKETVSIMLIIFVCFTKRNRLLEVCVLGSFFNRYDFLNCSKKVAPSK
jgi:hypothetical protein